MALKIYWSKWKYIYFFYHRKPQRFYAKNRTRFKFARIIIRNCFKFLVFRNEPLILTTTISIIYNSAPEHPLETRLFAKITAVFDVRNMCVWWMKHACLENETRVFQNETRLPFCETREFQGGLPPQKSTFNYFIFNNIEIINFK